MPFCLPADAVGGRAQTTSKGCFQVSRIASKINRRLALLLPAMLALVGSAARGATRPAAATRHDAVAAALVHRAEQAAKTFIRGDMHRWYGFVNPIAPDFTLMQPFGGPVSRGFDASDERLASMSRYFTKGEAELEIQEVYRSDDLVVLVMIERQFGVVGELPEQDWSLRVTQVFRRNGTLWELVHRHADPLVRNAGLERTAAIARGS